MTTMTVAAFDVLAERERQKTEEGWTTAHDDEHEDGSLALAAAAYAGAPALPTKRRGVERDVSCGRGETPVWGFGFTKVPICWPESWSPQWWKPRERREDLVRAAALLLAEIERIDRAALAEQSR